MESDCAGAGHTRLNGAPISWRPKPQINLTTERDQHLVVADGLLAVKHQLWVRQGLSNKACLHSGRRSIRPKQSPRAANGRTTTASSRAEKPGDQSHFKNLDGGLRVWHGAPIGAHFSKTVRPAELTHTLVRVISIYFHAAILNQRRKMYRFEEGHPDAQH